MRYNGTKVYGRLIGLRYLFYWVKREWEVGELLTYCVYILRSFKSHHLYIGQTNNFDRRLSEHQNGKHPATRNRGPWEVLYVIPFASRKEAVTLEQKLKSMKRSGRVLCYVEKLVQSVPTQDIAEVIPTLPVSG